MSVVRKNKKCVSALGSPDAKDASKKKALFAFILGVAYDPRG
jgi:hypothetical protein